MSTQTVIAIEGVGKTSSNQKYLFASGPAPAWDSAGVWVQSLISPSSGEIASSVDFRSGNATIGGVSLELVRSQFVAARLYESRRVSIARLTAPLLKGATTVSLSSTALSGFSVVIGREVIELGTYNAVTSSYPATRGRLDTEDLAHNIGPQDNTQVYNAVHTPYLKHRRLFLYRLNTSTATSYASLELMYSGILTSIAAPTPERIRIDADSISLTIERSKFYTERYNVDVLQTPNDTAGRVQWLASSLVGAGRLKRPLTSSPALFTVDYGALIQSEYNSSAGENWSSLHFGPQDLFSISVQSLPDPPTRLSEVLHCNAAPGAATNALPLSPNILTLFLQILTTTATGGNGSYDCGINGLGLGIPQSYVDFIGIEQVRAALGEEALRQPRLFLGLSEEPEDFVEYFKARLLAYGLAIVSTSTQITVVLLRDSGARNLPTLIEGVDLVGPGVPNDFDPPHQARRFDLSFDRLECGFSILPGRGPIVDTFIDSNARGAQPYSEGANLKINCEGIADRAVVTGLALDLIGRFHFEIPEVRVSALRTRSELELGSLVAVTHSKIFQKTGGALGVTLEPMLIVGRRLDLSKNIIDFTLLHLGALFDRVGDIAPAAVVTAYPGGAVISVAQNEGGGGFQSGTLTEDKDTSLIAAGYKVDLCTNEGVVRQAGLEVLSVAATQVTLTTTPTVTPAAGDVLRFSSYDTTTPAQKDFAALADSSYVLGSGNADPYEWTGL